MPLNNRREIGVDLLGINATDGFFRHSSSPRKAMKATHMGQAPLITGSEPRRILTGVEMEYGENTFDVRFPCDATVLRIVRKFPTGVGVDAIRHNPITTVIYEDYYDINKTVGIIQVPDFASFHQEFGFRYKRNPSVWEKLTPGAMFAKDERLARSPAVRDDGMYGVGLEAEVAFMSSPGAIEDGFILSESFLKRITPTTYSTLVGSWGRKAFPLNLYGDDTHYKPFPDIGDRIRDDGLVFALRDIDDDLAMAEMTPRALREVDYIFDRPLYGKPGAIVMDINVYHDDKLNPAYTPTGMDTQARLYYDAQAQYYRTLLEVYNELLSRRGKRLRISAEFNRLLVEAQIFLPQPHDKRKLSRVYRLDPLDEWRVEVTFEYQVPTGEGNKQCDTYGGKGVNCKTVPDEDMPVDANGNRAEVIIYGGSTVKRMNLGRVYEQFINAASRDLLHRLRRHVGLQPTIQPTAHQLTTIKNDASLVRYCWEHLLAYYKIVAPCQYALLEDDTDPARHVGHVLRDGIYLYIPPDNPVNNLEMAKELMDSDFRPHYGPVTYRNNAGEMVTTVDPILIGSLYMMLLEKTGDDWSGVASVKTNHFGVVSKLNNYDKHTSPGRQQGVRAMGEAESMAVNGTCGPETTMELLDQSKNPESHRVVVETILKSRHPTDIAKVVDRNRVKLGGARPVGLNNHFLACRGIRFVHVPDR